ncbi:MAG TPA: hypothetical protein VK177_02090 [Flavobacteriales bacterium]|nr:hypothetical protein [Flavobacteriales bacterium]
MTHDQHVEIARLQKEISKYIGGLDPESLIFDYHQLEGKVKLDIITVNPIHRQSFLFHTVDGFDKIDALFKMLKYVQTYKEKDSSYTIQWSLSGDPELHTSYFRAKNVWEALDKLTHSRDMNAIIVYSVVLNPIS